MKKSEYLVRIGLNIDSLRKKKDYTISYLGDIAGIGKNNLIPVIKGHRNITISTLAKIALALEVDPKELLK